MKWLLLSLFLLPTCMTAQVLSVCDALDRLSELNGKEVTIRAVWEFSDNGEWLWPSPACPHPFIKDGWVWNPTIAIRREEPRNYERWRATYELRSALQHKGSNPTSVMATLTGHLVTRDHFKVSRFSSLPEAYGYSPAALTITRAENLTAVPFPPQELARALQEANAPWPVRLKRKHP